MRVTVGEARIHADGVEQFAHPLLLGFAGGGVVLVQGFGDDGTHRHARVQAGLRVLEDHLHARSDAPQLLAAQGRDVPTVEQDAAACDVVEAQDRPAGRGLAAAGFADQSQGLAPADVEADAVDRLDDSDLAADDALVDGEMHAQVLDAQQHLGVGGPWLQAGRLGGHDAGPGGACHQQATWWPANTVASDGFSARQRSWT